MPSSPPTPEEIATRLLGAPPLRVEPVGHGGNSRVYRVERRDGPPLALKSYPADDHRERLEREFGALAFLHAHGFAHAPAPLVSDGPHALYEWIDGEPVDGDRALEQLLLRLAELHALRHEPAAAHLPPAREACLSGVDLERQLSGRLNALRAVERELELQRFLDDALAPLLARLLTRAQSLYRESGASWQRPLPRERQTLHPADFSFPNTLLRDGSLVLLDLEYFGWDDPAKLISDFPLQPEQRLGEHQRRRFLEATTALYGSDPQLPMRLSALRPLHAMRWCMILLNEFRADGRRRRDHAGKGVDAAVRTRQLERSRALLQRIEESRDT